MATFWGTHPDSVEIKDDVKENKVKYYSENVIDFELKKGADDLS